MFVRYCVVNVVENYVYIAYGEVNTAWKVGHIYLSLETLYVVTTRNTQVVIIDLFTQPELFEADARVTIPFRVKAMPCYEIIG